MVVRHDGWQWQLTGVNEARVANVQLNPMDIFFILYSSATHLHHRISFYCTIHSTIANMQATQPVTPHHQPSHTHPLIHSYISYIKSSFTKETRNLHTPLLLPRILRRTHRIITRSTPRLPTYFLRRPLRHLGNLAWWLIIRHIV